ncbi:TPA: TagK domain-containing protein [Morganella morganii]
MLLHFNWPTRKGSVKLTEQNTIDNPVAINAFTADVALNSGKDQDTDVLFYYTNTGPVLQNTCRDLVCFVNKQQVAFGSKIRLIYGSAVQIGHFSLSFVAAENNQSASVIEALTELTPVKIDFMNIEINEILPQGAGFISIEYAAEAYRKSGDELKKLEVEYKKFLLWGEIDSPQAETYTAAEEAKLSAADDDGSFDSLCEQIKDLNLTECIFETSAFMERVWRELSTMEEVDLTQDEHEDYDILRMLAPDGIIPYAKDSVSSLVSKELYKLGLDSRL